MATWGDARPGDRLLISGQEFVVTEYNVSTGIFSLRAPDGEIRRGKPNLLSPVEILPAEDCIVTLDTATAVARVFLGAVEIGERAREVDPWECPDPSTWDEVTKAHHMNIFHHGEVEHADSTAHFSHTHKEK